MYQPAKQSLEGIDGNIIIQDMARQDKAHQNIHTVQQV